MHATYSKRVCGLATALALGGCSDSVLRNSEAPFPEQLSELGLFEEMASRTPSEGVVPYTPPYRLYSNGLGKERLIALPGRTQIEVGEAWDFPVGTLLAKTFLDGDDPVETRLLLRRRDAWDYALYEWEGDQAESFGDNWASEVVELDETDDADTHLLPARLDCRTCHETSEERTGHPVLGLGPLQVDPELDETLFTEPPEPASFGRNAEEEAALGYFIANCLACHTGGSGTNASFSLHPDDAVDNTVDAPIVTEGATGTRVVPGEPDSSVVYISVVHAHDPDYDGPYKAMPPIGLEVADPSAADILGPWIEGL